MSTTLPYFSAEQIHQALDYPRLIGALREVFASRAQAPLRHAHAVGGREPGHLLLMPAWQEDQNIAVKIVTVFPQNRQRGVGTVAATLLLLDGVTGHPIALFDGEALTLRRTGAAAALASSYLSRPDASTLVIVGAGRLAPYMAHAHCAVRPIERVLIWARTPAAARQLAAQLAEEGLPATAAPGLPDALAQADIVSCATTSMEPIVLGKYLKAGVHVDLAGAFTPQMREADDDVVKDSRVFVDTYAGALSEAGDLVQPLQSGLIGRSHILAELADLCCARHAGRREPNERTLFKSVGTALEDLAAAQQVISAVGQTGQPDL